MIHHAFEEETLNYVMHEAALVVVHMDASGTIIQANAHAENLVGFTLAGKRFADIILDFKGTFSLKKAIVSDKQRYLLNVVTKSSLPQTYYFRFCKKAGALLAIGQQDVDEMEAMRRSLVKLNSDLNNLTRQLQKKNSQLEKLDALKNQFFGMAAHDLRYPLGLIQMYSEFLEDEAADQLNDEHRDFIGHIRKSSDLMAAILDDFLDFSAFQTGRLSLDSQHMDMVTWLTDIVRYNQTLANRNQIQLMLDIIPEQLAIRMDPSKMDQVVNNLLSNAIKYSPPKSRVQVGLQLNDSDAIIHVQDSGPGIAQSDWSRLFVPFERLTNINRSKEKSSGLGLAIVKKIVEAHGGRVWVDSQVGQGSTFFLALPLQEDDSPSINNYHS